MTQTEQPAKSKTVAIPAYLPLLRVTYAETTWESTFWPWDELRSNTRKLFQFEARNLRQRARSAERLRAMTRRYLMLAAGVSLLAGILFLLMQRAGIEVYTYILGILFAASILDKFYFDFVALAAGVDSISKDMTELRWDLLLLTDVRMSELIRAKHVVTQLRAWRTMVTVVALRLGVLILMLEYLFIEPLLHPRYEFYNGIYDLSITSIDELFVVLALVSVAVIAAAVYLLEPRWRLRALAAGGVRASAFSRDTTSGLMRTAGTFMRLWIGQISTVIVLIFASSVLSGIAAVLAEAIPLLALTTVGFALFCAWMIRSIYTLFTTRRLNEAYYRLVELGGQG
jgi:hypothetical protein